MQRATVAVLGVALAICVLAAPSTASDDVDGGSVAETPEEPSITFLSSPDFMNADVADLRGYWNWRHMRSQWKARFPGRRVPNSWNAHYRDTVNTVMRAFQGEQPDAVLVAGDLVNGHWGRDTIQVGRRRTQTGIFGATGTFREKRAALNRAANFYFGRYRQLFTTRGLPLYPAVGDHEYGDNPWSGNDPNKRFKRRTMPDIRKRFNQVFLRGRGLSRPSGPARRTAYATWLHQRAADDPGVLLVTLDEFRRTTGRVVGAVDSDQLAWLRKVLGGASADDWVIVQGHLPIIPGVRQFGSSALCYQGGTTSPLWRTMAGSGKVDLYLNGEVHDNSRKDHAGLTQISHGGIIGSRTRGSTSYLVGQVYPDRLELSLKRFVVDDWRRTPTLYQVTPPGSPAGRKHIRPTPPTIGRMTLDRATGAVPGTDSGFLRPYAGPGACGTTYRSHY